MSLFRAWFLRMFPAVFPAVNSHSNQKRQPGDAEPSEDDACDGHAVAG
jgi:hypothetical protein